MGPFGVVFASVPVLPMRVMRLRLSMLFVLCSEMELRYSVREYLCHVANSGE